MPDDCSAAADTEHRRAFGRMREGWPTKNNKIRRNKNEMVTGGGSSFIGIYQNASRYSQEELIIKLLQLICILRGNKFLLEWQSSSVVITTIRINFTRQMICEWYEINIYVHIACGATCCFPWTQRWYTTMDEHRTRVAIFHGAKVSVNVGHTVQCTGYSTMFERAGADEERKMFSVQRNTSNPPPKWLRLMRARIVFVKIWK